MENYQNFDTKACGCSKNQRPVPQSITIHDLIAEKTQIEIFISRMIEEQLEKFELRTKVPVKAINVHLINVTDQHGEDSNTIQTDIHLNLNAL